MHRPWIAALMVSVIWLACRTDEVGTRPAEDDPILAEVGGEIITQSQVDAWIRDDLFRRGFEEKNENDRYELRAAALDAMVEKHVLDAAAKQAGLSTEEVLARETEALGPVTDEEVTAYYEERKEALSGVPFEELKPRIRLYLEHHRDTQAKKAIRERAEVVWNLERPRFDVEATGPSKGPDDARVTIVEFSDFECPFCKRSAGIVKSVLERYPDDVRLVYRHFPLDAIHHNATPAAEAAACAADQGRFWPYHDLLFANNKKLGAEQLREYAEQAELDLERFDKCVGERSFQELVKHDAEAARTAGVNGTPAFFVNGVLLNGSRPADDFVEVIDEELARLDKSSS